MRSPAILFAASLLATGFSTPARAEPPELDNLEFTRLLRAHIVHSSGEKVAGDMKEYQGKIPKTGAAYAMAPIPGGSFLMGSPPLPNPVAGTTRDHNAASKSAPSGWAATK